MLATRDGMSIRFHESDVREMGRATTGVKGIELDEGDTRHRHGGGAPRLHPAGGEREGLSASAPSWPSTGCRSAAARGIITLKRTDKTGAIVALKEVIPEDELMMITRQGIIIRVPVDGIRVIGRNTQGVKVMNLDEGDAVVGVARVVKEDEARRGGARPEAVAPADGDA